MAIYQNDHLGVKFESDDDMDLIFHGNISDFNSPEFENFQRNDKDLPSQDRDYRVLFSASKLEFGALLVKEVTCRVRKSPESDGEFRSLYENKADWRPLGDRKFSGRSAECYMSLQTPLLQFFTDSANGYRLTGDIRAESNEDVERLAKRLMLR